VTCRSCTAHTSSNAGCKLWFLDGKDDKGKIVSNPNIGYGSYTIKYADGTTRDFYQIGLSANTTGISVYIMGIKDKKYLANTYGKNLGKASVTGYCIKFKTIKDINVDILQEAIRDGVEITGKVTDKNKSYVYYNQQKYFLTFTRYKHAFYIE
jgi:hypothetical protein